MKDTRSEFERNLPGAQCTEDMEKYKDGDQIFLRMYCAHCHWNLTDEIGFVLHGREYCVKCYPAIVNAHLAAEKIRKAQKTEVS